MFQRAVEWLLRTVYGLVDSGDCRNRFCNDITASPWVFCKVVDGKWEMLAVVYVDDILVHAKDQAVIDRFMYELRQKFEVNDMGDARY